VNRKRLRLRKLPASWGSVGLLACLAVAGVAIALVTHGLARELVGAVAIGSIVIGIQLAGMLLRERHAWAPRSFALPPWDPREPYVARLRRWVQSRHGSRRAAE
jgi:hypothetical protein